MRLRDRNSLDSSLSERRSIPRLRRQRPLVHCCAGARLRKVLVHGCAADPVEGGCSNDYAYVYGDPINQSDLSGAVSSCYNLSPQDYHSEGAISGSTFTVDERWGEIEWNFQVGAAYGRGQMGNVVSIWEGGISNYLKKGKRRLRAPVRAA